MSLELVCLLIGFMNNLVLINLILIKYTRSICIVYIGIDRKTIIYADDT